MMGCALELWGKISLLELRFIFLGVLPKWQKPQHIINDPNGECWDIEFHFNLSIEFVFNSFDLECIFQNSVVLPNLYAPANLVHPSSKSSQHREAEEHREQSLVLFYGGASYLLGLAAQFRYYSLMQFTEINTWYWLVRASIQKRLLGNIIILLMTKIYKVV